MPAQPEHTVVLESRPSPAVTVTLPADLAVRSVRDWLPDRTWMGPVAGLAAGGLLARLLFGELQRPAGRIGVGELMLAGAVALLVAGLVLRRRAKQPLLATVAVVPPPRAEPPPASPTDLDRGVHAIRRTDRGFDPARFSGYAAMMFRDVEGAAELGGSAAAYHVDRLRAGLAPPFFSNKSPKVASPSVPTSQASVV